MWHFVSQSESKLIPALAVMTPYEMLPNPFTPGITAKKLIIW
jgi:hypothetical protein